MAELSPEILSELQFIKWLLIALVIIGMYFTFTFFVAINRVEKGEGLFGKKIQHKKREAELDEMLAKGNAFGAKFTALEWVTSHPNEPWAHWYLAKAYDQLGKYVETKQTLLHIKEISPSWNDSIEPWLESNEEHLIPKGVK